MSEFETQAGGTATNEVGMLRLLISAAIFLMCVAVCCVGLLMRQNSKELGANLEAAQKTLEMYQNNDAKRAGYFFSTLRDYAKNHPDFQSIMQTTDRYLASIQSQAQVVPGIK